jgi:hypothetical protein
LVTVEQQIIVFGDGVGWGGCCCCCCCFLPHQYSSPLPHGLVPLLVVGLISLHFTSRIISNKNVWFHDGLVTKMKLQVLNIVKNHSLSFQEIVTFLID